MAVSALERLRDRYVVESYLTNRSGGWFYRVHLREAPERRFLLRVFSPALNQKNEQAFTDTTDIAVDLEHPGLTKLWEFGQYADPVKRRFLYYCVEDDYDPDGLCVTRELMQAELMPLERLYRVATDLANALAYLERCKRVHGDVKPGNILLRAEGAALIHPVLARLTGIQRERNEHDKPTVADFCRAPELDGTQPNLLTDQYALAAVLFFLATGTLPRSVAEARDAPGLGAPDALVLRPDLAPAFAEVLVRGLQVDPRRRFPDLASCAQALRSVARGGGGPAGTRAGRRRSADFVREEAPHGSVASARRRPPLALLIGGAVLAVLLVVGLVAALWGGDPGADPGPGATPDPLLPLLVADPVVAPPDPAVVSVDPPVVDPPGPTDPVVVADPLEVADPPVVTGPPEVVDPAVVIRLVDPPVVADPGDPVALPEPVALAPRVLAPLTGPVALQDIWCIRFGQACQVGERAFLGVVEAEALGLQVASAGQRSSQQWAERLVPDQGAERALVRQYHQFKDARELTVHLPVVDGHYAVSLWQLETLKNRATAFEVLIEGEVRSRVGGSSSLGELDKHQWLRFDFAPLAVSDGSLDLRLRKLRGDGALALFAIAVARQVEPSQEAPDPHVPWTWSAADWRPAADGELPEPQARAAGAPLLRPRLQSRAATGRSRGFHRPVAAAEHPRSGDLASWTADGRLDSIVRPAEDGRWQLRLAAGHTAQLLLPLPHDGRYRLVRWRVESAAAVELRLSRGAELLHSGPLDEAVELGVCRAGEILACDIRPGDSEMALNAELDWALERLADPRPSPLVVTIVEQDIRIQRRRGQLYQVILPIAIGHPDGGNLGVSSATLQVPGGAPVAASLDGRRATCTWNEVPEGIHTLRVDLVDAEGGIASSPTIRLVVGRPALPALLLVGKNGAQDRDRQVIAGLRQHGDLAVRALRIQDLDREALQDIHLLLISDSAELGECRLPLEDLALPILTWNRWAYPHLGLTGNDKDLDHGELDKQSKIPRRGGAAIRVYQDGGRITWGRVAGEVVPVLAMGESAVVFLLRAGASDARGHVAPAARAGLGFLLEPQRIHDDGWQVVGQCLDAMLDRAP